MLQLLKTTTDVCSPHAPSLGTSEQLEGRQRGGEEWNGNTDPAGNMLGATLAFGTLPVPEESPVIADVQQLKQLNRRCTDQVCTLSRCSGWAVWRVTACSGALNVG